MNDAAREARNAYQRAWRAKNRSRTRAYQERYWTRRAAEQSEGDGEVKAHEQKKSA